MTDQWTQVGAPAEERTKEQKLWELEADLDHLERRANDRKSYHGSFEFEMRGNLFCDIRSLEMDQEQVMKLSKKLFKIHIALERKHYLECTRECVEFKLSSYVRLWERKNVSRWRMEECIAHVFYEEGFVAKNSPLPIIIWDESETDVVEPSQSSLSNNSTCIPSQEGKQTQPSICSLEGGGMKEEDQFERGEDEPSPTPAPKPSSPIHDLRVEESTRTSYREPSQLSGEQRGVGEPTLAKEFGREGVGVFNHEGTCVEQAQLVLGNEERKAGIDKMGELTLAKGEGRRGFSTGSKGQELAAPNQPSWGRKVGSALLGESILSAEGRQQEEVDNEEMEWSISDPCSFDNLRIQMTRGLPTIDTG